MFLVFDPDTSGPSDLFFAFVYGISVIRVSVILGLTVLFVLLLVRTLLVHQTFFCFCLWYFGHTCFGNTGSYSSFCFAFGPNTSGSSDFFLFLFMVFRSYVFR